MFVAGAAVLACAALGLGGCGAGDVGTAEVSADGSGAEGAEDATASALPPGVLPPNDPPQPGDARLRPDGHYDYSAPDFVLKNPCDTVYFQRAMELGWKVPPFGTKRRDEPSGSDCTMINDRTGMALTTYPMSIAGLKESGHEVSIAPDHTPSLLIVKGNALFGESCFAGVETANGIFGATAATGGFSPHSRIEDACTESIATVVPIIGG